MHGADKSDGATEAVLWPRRFSPAWCWFAVFLAAACDGSAGQHRTPRPVVGVRVGKGLLVRERFFVSEDLGAITDLAHDSLESGGGAGLIACGSRGFAVLDPATGELRELIQFKRTDAVALDDVGRYRKIVDLDSDGELEFLAIGKPTQVTAVHDVHGELNWAHPPTVKIARAMGTNHFLVADLDRDGCTEILFASIVHPAVHVVDCKGRIDTVEEWVGGRMTTSPVAVDVDGDGRMEIIYVTGDTVRARHLDGRLAWESEIPDKGYGNFLEPGSRSDIDNVLFVGWYDKSSKPAGQKYRTLDAATGSFVRDVAWAEVESSTGTLAHTSSHGSGVRFRLDVLQEQRAIAGIEAAWLRLRVFDSRGVVMYEEVLPDRAPQDAKPYAAALEGPELPGVSPRFFVAYGDTVWSYTWAQ
jgi:hypothetical protein